MVKFKNIEAGIFFVKLTMGGMKEEQALDYANALDGEGWL